MYMVMRSADVLLKVRWLFLRVIRLADMESASSSSLPVNVDCEHENETENCDRPGPIGIPPFADVGGYVSYSNGS